MLKLENKLTFLKKTLAKSSKLITSNSKTQTNNANRYITLTSFHSIATRCYSKLDKNGGELKKFAINF